MTEIDRYQITQQVLDNIGALSQDIMDLDVDKAAAMRILGIQSYSTLKRYTTAGKNVHGKVVRLKSAEGRYVVRDLLRFREH